MVNEATRLLGSELSCILGRAAGSETITESAAAGDSTSDDDTFSLRIVSLVMLLFVGDKGLIGTFCINSSFIYRSHDRYLDAQYGKGASINLVVQPLHRAKCLPVSYKL